MSDFSTAIFSISIVIISGIVAGRLAENFSFPKTIPLILAGIILTMFSVAIDLNAIRDMAVITAELALITVLFKEGMHLNLKNFQKHFLTIILIAIFGTILTTIIVGFSVNLALGLPLVTALLVGAIFTPTDPAATFAALRGNGSTRIQEKYESILGGESALNDVIAITIVVVILLPTATTNSNINLNFDVLALAVYEFVGGVIMGLAVGYITLIFINYLPSKTEESMVSLAGAALIFGLSFVTNTSSAIAALVAGIVLANPKSFGRSDYSKNQINLFWENITFLFEILAFIFIGAIFNFSSLNENLVIFAIILSVIVFFGRFAGFYLIRWIFEFSDKTKDDLSNKDRFFIGFAGMRGLTTAILATLAYISFGEGSEFGELILYSSILVLIFTGLFQGLFLRKVAQVTNVIEEVDEIEEILARKIVVRSSLNFLMDRLQEKTISFDDFSRLSLHLKEELYLLEEHLLHLQAESQRNITFLNTAIAANDQAREALQHAYEIGEIQNDLAFEKANSTLDIEKKDLIQLLEKIKPSHPVLQPKPAEIDLETEIDRNLAEAAIDVLKDPKINNILGIDVKSIMNSIQKSIHYPKNVINPSKVKNIKKDAG